MATDKVDKDKKDKDNRPSSVELQNDLVRVTLNDRSKRTYKIANLRIRTVDEVMDAILAHENCPLHHLYKTPKRQDIALYEWIPRRQGLDLTQGFSLELKSTVLRELAGTERMSELATRWEQKKKSRYQLLLKPTNDNSFEKKSSLVRLPKLLRRSSSSKLKDAFELSPAETQQLADMGKYVDDITGRYRCTHATTSVSSEGSLTGKTETTMVRPISQLINAQSLKNLEEASKPSIPVEVMIKHQEMLISWSNRVLSPYQMHISNLHFDIRNGVALLHMLEAVSGSRVRNYHQQPSDLQQRLQNCDLVLKFYGILGIRVIGSRPKDLYHGNISVVFGTLFQLVKRVANKEILPPSRKKKKTKKVKKGEEPPPVNDDRSSKVEALELSANARFSVMPGTIPPQSGSSTTTTAGAISTPSVTLSARGTIGDNIMATVPGRSPSPGPQPNVIGDYPLNPDGSPNWRISKPLPNPPGATSTPVVVLQRASNPSVSMANPQRASLRKKLPEPPATSSRMYDTPPITEEYSDMQNEYGQPLDGAPQEEDFGGLKLLQSDPQRESTLNLLSNANSTLTMGNDAAGPSHDDVHDVISSARRLENMVSSSVRIKRPAPRPALDESQVDISMYENEICYTYEDDGTAAEDTPGTGKKLVDNIDARIKEIEMMDLVLETPTTPVASPAPTRPAPPADGSRFQGSRRKDIGTAVIIGGTDLDEDYEAEERARRFRKKPVAGNAAEVPAQMEPEQDDINDFVDQVLAMPEPTRKKRVVNVPPVEPPPTMPQQTEQEDVNAQGTVPHDELPATAEYPDGHIEVGGEFVAGWQSNTAESAEALPTGQEYQYQYEQPQEYQQAYDYQQQAADYQQQAAEYDQQTSEYQQAYDAGQAVETVVAEEIGAEEDLDALELNISWDAPDSND